jgi:hypothetical protein
MRKKNRSLFMDWTLNSLAVFAVILIGGFIGRVRHGRELMSIDTVLDTFFSHPLAFIVIAMVWGLILSSVFRTKNK